MKKIKGLAYITKEEVENGLEICSTQILHKINEFGEKFLSSCSENLFYIEAENKGWTNGFWTGEIWLAYEFSENPVLKEIALKQCDSFGQRIRNRVAVDMHDMGFLYSPSCVAAYKLIGDEKAKETALMAADNLRSMFRPVGEFIQSCGKPNEPEYYRMIVDCLMNIPLLYWASEITGDNSYREVADKHFMTTAKNVMREDGSTYQVMCFDIQTGILTLARTNQGYSDDSAWARGQAWAIYGPAIAYKYTGKQECLNVFRRAASYFMEHLPENLIPYFDLCFTEGDEWPRDSSASAAAACGMLEMAKYLDEEEAQKYVGYAKQLVKALYDHCMVRTPEQSNGLLLHGTYCCVTPYNRQKVNRGKDECCSFGDYFFMEALTRLHKNWEMYW